MCVCEKMKDLHSFLINVKRYAEYVCTGKNSGPSINPVTLSNDKYGNMSRNFSFLNSILTTKQPDGI